MRRSTKTRTMTHRTSLARVDSVPHGSRLTPTWSWGTRCAGAKRNCLRPGVSNCNCHGEVEVVHAKRHDGTSSKVTTSDEGLQATEKNSTAQDVQQQEQGCNHPETSRRPRGTGPHRSINTSRQRVQGEKSASCSSKVVIGCFVPTV